MSVFICHYSRIPAATNVALEETIDGATIRSVSHSAVTNTATYDAYRRETVRTDGRGNATTNAYDMLGRLASVTDPLGATTHYAYDAIGNLVAVTNALGNATIYEYDLRGNKAYEGGAHLAKGIPARTPASGAMRWGDDDNMSMYMFYLNDITPTALTPPTISTSTRSSPTSATRRLCGKPSSPSSTTMGIRLSSKPLLASGLSPTTPRIARSSGGA